MKQDVPYECAHMINVCQICEKETTFGSDYLYGVDLYMRDRKNFFITGEIGSFLHNKYNKNLYICVDCANKINEFIDTLKEEKDEALSDGSTT